MMKRPFRTTFGLAALLLVAVLTAATQAVGPPSEIPLEIVEPADRGVVQDWPVTVGVVVPQGLLNSLDGTHLTENGVEIHFEADVTGYWPKATGAPSGASPSIKWVLLHFKASTDRDYRFVLGPGTLTHDAVPLAIESPTEIQVDTGLLRAVISKQGPDLLDAVELGGVSQLRLGEPVSHAMTVVDDDPPGGGLPSPSLATFDSVQTTVEINTWRRATVLKTGIYRWDGRDIARLDVRYEFFENEAFVRLHHTVTWLEHSPATPYATCSGSRADVSIRASDVSLSFPFVDPAETTPLTRLHVGLDSPSAVATFDLPGSASETVIQNAPHAVQAVNAGTHHPNLAGWLALELDAGARHAGIVVRDLWQTYPKLATAGSETLSLSLWSDATGAAVGDAHRGLSFEVQDILPQDAWTWDGWKDMSYAEEFFEDCLQSTALPDHFVHEWWKVSDYEHTGEGVARSHEVVLNFENPAVGGRPIEQLNDLVQRPVAMRQAPDSAMAVRYRGLDIPPVHPTEHSDMERAIDQVGHFTFARWESLNDYGVWRYGKTRYHAPSEGFGRWYDNLQYNQQEIPLLLWMRGGDRRYFEEAHTLSRFAIDVNFDHSEQGRPGAGVAAAGLPLPWIDRHVVFGTKFDFLALYYHLTGYPRAIELLGTATRSLIAELEDEDTVSCLAGGRWVEGPYDRAVYNTFGNLLTAWAEQEILDLTQTERDLVECWLTEILSVIETREFLPEHEITPGQVDVISSFRSSHYYLFENLVHLQDLAPGTSLDALVDADLEKIMLDALAARGWPGLGQPRTSLVPAPNFTNYAAALGWAFERTLQTDIDAATEIATLSRDLARRTRDSIPDFDAGYLPGIDDSRDDERGVYPFIANQSFHQVLIPMLVGLGTEQAAAQSGISLPGDAALTDLFVHSGVASPILYVRSNSSDEIQLTVSLRDLGQQTPYRNRLPRVEVRVFDVPPLHTRGPEFFVGSMEIKPAALTAQSENLGAGEAGAGVARMEQFWRPNPTLTGTLTELDGKWPGQLFRVEFWDADLGTRLTNSSGLFIGAVAVHVDADDEVTGRAGLVHALAPSSVPKFAGAYSGHMGGVTLHTLVTEAHPKIYTTASTVTVRDSKTDELLDRMPFYRPEPQYPSNVRDYQTVGDLLDNGNWTRRLVSLTYSGEDSWVLFFKTGYARFVAATRDEWFDPADP